MDVVIIRYIDSTGQITDRRISDIVPAGPDTFEAFCHLRNDRRTFKLQNVLTAVDPETGEMLPHLCRPTLPEGGQSKHVAITPLIGNAMPAIKALKFFTLVLRGFAKRERGHLVRFMKHTCTVSNFSDEKIEQWLQKLWCGDIYKYRAGDHSEYDALVQSIPTPLKPACLQTALDVAAGSRRRPIDPDVLAGIHRDFGS